MINDSVLLLILPSLEFGQENEIKLDIARCVEVVDDREVRGVAYLLRLAEEWCCVRGDKLQTVALVFLSVVRPHQDVRIRRTQAAQADVCCQMARYFLGKESPVTWVAVPGSMPFRVERNDLISPWLARTDERADA